MELESKKILVIDDDANMVEIIKMAFESEYQVLSASDGKEGIETARKEKPDLIILDVMMPKMSGYEVLKLLLSDDDTKNIPVIVFTASHFDPSTEMVFRIEKNVKAFLRKPCTIGILKEEVKNALSGR